MLLIAGLLADLVVGRFLHDADVVNVAFRDAGVGDADELGVCAERLQIGASGVPHAGAQSAHQQALLLAKSLLNQLNGKPLLPFVYEDKGSLISLSKGGSVGNIMGNLSKDFTFEGKIARLMYVTLYRMHQHTLHGTLRTLLLILRDKINRRASPTLKLH